MRIGEHSSGDALDEAEMAGVKPPRRWAALVCGRRGEWVVVVVALWLVLLVAVAPLAHKLTDAQYMSPGQR
ncbi:hypothetical protein ABZ461_29925 [Actinacidiphila glaucinigra]|uniref:hypothetical protein n=1 Tax=Actinacidiphila glaucinigra TaxID=235986 RepID=UPI0033D8FC26